MLRTRKKLLSKDVVAKINLVNSNLYSVDEIASMFNIKPDSVRRIHQIGRLEMVKQGKFLYASGYNIKQYLTNKLKHVQILSDEVLSFINSAKYLGVVRSMMYKYVKSGLIRPKGIKGKRFFYRSQLDEFREKYPRREW